MISDGGSIIVHLRHRIHNGLAIRCIGNQRTLPSITAVNNDRSFWIDSTEIRHDTAKCFDTALSLIALFIEANFDFTVNIVRC
ncbi:hypothetical protein D3C86_2014360 [compost metagenome]